jgi:hypothetical protein
MSRASQRSPQKQPSRTPIASPSRTRVGSPMNVPATPTPRPRTKSTPKPPAGITTRKVPDQIDSPPVKTNVNIREAIALKRAEAKRSALKGAGGGLESLEDLRDVSPVACKQNKEDDAVDLGRWSVRQTIERARSTGKHRHCSPFHLPVPCLL